MLDTKKEDINTNTSNNNKQKIVVQKEPKKNKNSKGRRKKKNKKIIPIFGFFLLIIGLIVFILMTPIFNITNIEVKGNNHINQDNIISLSEIKKGENIFKISKKSIEKIKENSYVDNAEIKKHLPGTVEIIIKEREVKYQINLISSFVYIDKNGYILENSTVKKEIPTIVGLSITENELINKKRLEKKDLENLNKITKIIDSAKKIEIDTLVTEINVEDENDIYLYLEAKQKKIYIGDTTNLTNKMLYIQKILEQEEGKKGIIFINKDISSGFKPYFREE